MDCKEFYLMVAQFLGHFMLILALFPILGYLIKVFKEWTMKGIVIRAPKPE
jgi:hypothetical protein